MDDTKPWWQSRGIWGGLIALVATAVSVLLHKTIPADSQSALVDGIIALAQAVGGILAVWGRATAIEKVALK